MAINYSYRYIGKFLQKHAIYLMLFLSSCQQRTAPHTKPAQYDVYIEILGTIQDAGYPQLGCMKACCREQWGRSARSKKIISIGLIDALNKESYLFEASPDIKDQIQQLAYSLDSSQFSLPSGIFLTHAHIGHYAGLMYLGRESMNANNQPVYCMSDMYQYLKTSGPWQLLDSLHNINLRRIEDRKSIELNNQLLVVPIQVPHRGEYSETVGYIIEGPNKKAVFIPDIDKWEKWSVSIDSLIQEVDYALLDATFFKNGEIPGRDMSEIPHPFMEESFDRFDSLSAQDRQKIHFIHFNHTNPIIDSSSMAYQTTIQKGYKVCQEFMRLPL